ncbi:MULTISPECIES: multicopper oxidase family protein [Lysinibacillus]|uniref:multicopper oxidase family protein n=1 Tax=Lysinibacillus TaxID=400634 RepID=UPI00237E81F0|nr:MULTISPECIES: multicopper oxidase [Lysinibacillus]MED3799362.1 multicopper oxidase [Lysinibacillus capsici]UNT57859.1 multicopper oxidase domain-containing protein [Lysinibacillus capsici]WDU81869.1 multicopper oxidase [Lysinibacillus sp. G01H]
MQINPSDPATIPKFVDELPKPMIAKPKYSRGQQKNDYYELVMMEGQHRFHKHFPNSLIWGYNGLYPGPTIEASKDKTIYVKYKNQLPLQHFLPVDFTLHAANDSQEVRTVTHLHGANVDWQSDGHPEAWYTKDYRHTGPKFNKEIHEYTNHQPGTTMWYHDHAMALTRLNVYAGLAGFYLLRDALEERSNLPCGDYEYPILIQDKSFNEDGSLFYPDEPPFPVPVHPSITPGFVGNTIVVNGKLWPYLDVEPRKYRFRFLNGSNRRGYVISLSNGQPMFQIGTDGGLLPAPQLIQSVELLPAERTDVIIDFSSCAGQEITLLNTDTDFSDEHTNVIMQFRVILPLKCEDTSEIPERLAVSMDLHPHHAHIERQLPLTATTDEFGRPMLLLNDRMYHDPATEKPSLDSVEIWNFINATPFIHPIHLHLIQFKILERRPFDLDIYQNEGIVQFTGPPEEPRDYERGWKDTVKADAGKVTKIIMHWKDHVGNYMWHCHFLEHEDHDMMRPILVMKDVHAVQQPHAAVEHPVTHQESTAPTSTTSTTHHSEFSAPLLNEVEHSVLEEEKVALPNEEESITIHIGDNTRHMPTLLLPTLPTNTPTNRHSPRRRTRRF